jgi:cleavage and polyadenylation specificity factor subunit 1
MATDGAVVAFAPLHNVNCAAGFVFITDKVRRPLSLSLCLCCSVSRPCVRRRQGVLKICQLSADMALEHTWPVLKVPQRCTVSRVAHHYERNLYVLCASTLEPAKEDKMREFSLEAGAHLCVPALVLCG